jgi:type II secretory pathway pseudopilin PulG
MDTRTTIIAVIILAILVAFVLARILMNKNKEEAKDEAIKFLNSLADKFEAVIIKHIKDIDFKNLDNLSDIEKQILDETINELWIIVQDQLTTYVTKESTREILRIIIDKDFLLNFITNFFKEDKPVQEAYAAKYEDAVAYKFHQAQQFEKDTVQQNFEYQTEDLSKEEKVTPIDPNLRYDFSEGTRENPGKVIEKPLNPQPDITDEELVYSIEDNSVELVEESAEEENVREELKKTIEKQD